MLHGNGVAPSPTPWCSSYWKGSLRVILDNSHQLFFVTFYLYIFYLLLCLFTYLFIQLLFIKFLFIVIFYLFIYYVRSFFIYCYFLFIHFLFIALFIYSFLYIVMFYLLLCLLTYFCPVSLGCRIHQQHLCWEVRPLPPTSVLGYDIRQSDGEVPVMGPLWPRVVAPDRVLSMG